MKWDTQAFDLPLKPDEEPKAEIAAGAEKAEAIGLPKIVFQRPAIRRLCVVGLTVLAAAALAFAVILAVRCWHPAFAFGGPAMILKDFSDTPFQEGLGKMSEDCVYDLNFDGSDDLLWFDLNYPLDRGGCQPMVVGIQVGGERIRLESYDVEKLYAFVLADLNLKDSRCDLIVSMRQASDGEEKTSVISISHHGKADFWHTESAYAEGQTASLFDGRFRGISPDGVIQIGEASFIPARGRILIRQ